MIRAALTSVLLSSLKVTAMNWAMTCKTDREKCSNYCRDWPQFCTAVCEADPTIPGCPATTPPPSGQPPKCPEVCCYAETPGCKACQACMDPSEWCANNLDFPGCEEYCCEQGCSSSCRMKPNGTIFVQRTCKWRVLDQSHNAFRPVLLEANVEKDCPFAVNYGLHLETCRHCAAEHAPCQDTYMACGGCCGTPWHDTMNLGINTHHTCDEIKGYFKVKNYVNVECEEVTAANADKPDGDFQVQEIAANTSRVVDEGKLQTNCSTEIRSLDCKQIPLRMRFECDDCGNKGSADLLDQCCDKCVQWAQKAERGEIPGIPANIKPFIFCSGCDATTIVPLDPTFAANPALHFPWNNAHKYVEYTEKAADDGVEQFIEDKVCALLAPTCSTGTTSEPPAFLSSTTKPQHECLAGEGGTCAAWDDETLVSGTGGRRLARDERRLKEMRGKDVVCENMNFEFYEEAKDVHPNATKAYPALSKAFEEREHAMRSQTAAPVASTGPPTPEITGPEVAGSPTALLSVAVAMLALMVQRLD